VTPAANLDATDPPMIAVLGDADEMCPYADTDAFVKGPALPVLMRSSWRFLALRILSRSARPTRASVRPKPSIVFWNGLRC
jgi:hypothetical protein